MPQLSTAKFIVRLLDSLKTHEDKIAVVDQNGQRQTTYKEFFTMACKVAGYLLQQNYPPHSFIGICLPTSREYLASEIGIWLAGHAIVPMGDKYPKDRIEYIMQHCESPLLINDEVIQAMMKTEPSENYVLPNENDINALYYTSGSTGAPKGVLHNFRSLGSPVPLDELLAEQDLYIMGATTPFFFIASRSVFCIIYRGGCIHFIAPEVVKDIHQLESYLALHHIEFTFLPPSVLANFKSRSSDLKLVMTGAERLSNIYFEDFKLINHYGQTETCGAGATFVVDKTYETTPIGKPGSHVEYCIMDQDGNNVPQGEEGEFCLKGNLAIGYYNDPVSTAELYKYGWLHTGDIVRELPNGNLVFVERKDWMLKINGQRVEPGEVEAVIKQIDGVTNAVVKGFTTKNRQYLCAYYIACDNISEDTIRKYLLSKLPAYMVPSYFVRMEHFPLLPSGKTDRKSLLAPTVQAEGIVRPPYAEPTNHIERQLCEAFEKMLSVDRVGIDDDFFELGGDSIRVMEVQTLCPDLQLSSRMIYASRTPKKIAEACAHTESVSYTHHKDYPLSQTQLGIYVECMSRQGEVAYNNGMLFQLNPSIDANRLSKACETVVEAHPYIKTRLFVDSQGNPRQLRNDAETYHQSVETYSQQAFEKLKPELIRPFDLLKDRLFRIRILKTQEAQYLYIDFHHIIFDGVSFNTILKDLKDAYEQLPVERESFTGYEIALEEESLRKTEAYISARQWYMEQFGSLKVSSLPVPEKQDSHITYGQEHLELTVDYNQLQEVADYFGVTPNVLTTTVFGYLLGVNTHAQESLFATIFSGRQDLKTLRTVTMLVKTLPVYTKWDQETTVRELLQTTKQQLMGSMSNSLFSFAEAKAMNHVINSHILFAYQGDLMPSDSDLFTYQPLMENATGEDLAFEILRNGTKLILHTEYHSNQYTLAFIQRLMHCYNTILEGFLNSESEDKRLCELPILTDDEQQAILALGTGHQLDYDKTETIVDLFHRQATLTPENIAVVDEVSEITYAELDRRSDLLATALRKAGVGTDTFVAVMLPRRKEFLIAVFAVLKAGGAYVPLDNEYPKERLAYILNDSDTYLLITTSTILEARQTEQYFPQEKQLLIDDFDFNRPSDHPVNFAQPSGLAYMIYTSGTAGNPKGVMIEHKNLRAFLQFRIDLLHLTQEDRCAQHASFSFDASLDDLLSPLVKGAQVHILSSELRQDIKGMIDYFTRNRITGLTMSTQLGIEMLSNFSLSLRYLMLGGSKMHHIPTGNTKVINGYGPTEFTVCSSYYTLERDEKHDNIPIGRPVPNSISVVVDTQERLVPQGTVGELCLIGHQISRGYWKQEELTRKRFVDSPFLSGQKMYHTGDLVRWNEEGLLEYIGRIDNQIKLYGYRIELEEIESKMSHCPGVVSAAIVVHKEGNIEFIVGYYTSEGNQELPDIQELLMAELPSYMVPSQLIRIDEIPLTPNGKIDRKALPTLMNQTEVVKPDTTMERHVFDIVSEQLKTSQFGVTDNLVFHGLSSLSAMRLAFVLENRLCVKIRMADIMKMPTIRAIAAKLETSEKANSLHPFAPQTFYPLMENQRGLYLEWEKAPHTTQYNISFIYNFEGIDADRMVEALKLTVNAHPYLKSKLMVENGEVVLQRNDQDPVDVKVCELNEEPDHVYFQKRVLPFHLLGDQLYRLEVLKMPHKTYLFFDVHHIIFDGLSIDIFMRDLRRAYDGHDLSTESFQAFDYVLYEQRQQDNERMKKAEKWMDMLLADAQVLSYPNSSKPDGVANASIKQSIPKQEIDTFCSNCQVTTNSYMHAAFATAMQRVSRDQKPLYLTVDNGREAGAELMQCIGMFVRTLPFVNTCHETNNLSTTAYVQETQRLLQESYNMDYYPLTAIVERHQIHPEVMFAYQGGLQEGRSFDQMEQVALEPDKAKFPLSFVVNDEEDAYTFILEYDGLRYDRQQMQLLLSAVCMAARHLAVAETVGQVKLVSKEEELSLLTLGTGLSLDYNRSQTFVSLFKKQVTQAPDAIAVIDAQSSITYQELDRQSDILAVRLKELGVSDGSFVSIMLPRTKEFLVTVIAIFKAGGAYVPLDSDIPKDRLHFMLKDSQTVVLLTTRAWLSKTESFEGIPVLLIEDIDWTTSSVAIDDSCPTSLAYMIYTSGSTGEPKGVTVTHEAMMNFIIWLKNTEELKTGDQCAIHTNFVFDGSLFDLYPPLISGATLHILSSSLRMNLHGMYRYFIDHHIVGMLLTTQMGMMMMSNYELPLRFLMVGGEKLTGFHIPPSMKLYNCYGPTEFAVCSAFHQVDRLRTYDNIPIGRPVPNTVSAVIDDKGHLLPRGIAGELCLIGRQMAQGYWNRPKLTEEFFTDCPFITGEKMYHTRDLVRWNNEGELEYLGRMDSQLKIRGYRIELGEIEKKITEFPGVTSAAVIVHQEQETQYLVGYFTSKTPVDPEMIQEHLKRLLPEYMTPQFLVHLPAMPMNINGKINHRELIDNHHLSQLTNKGSIAPMTKDEKTLYELTKQVLKMDGFGVTDDLTLLGLTSISAIKLVDLAQHEGLYIKVNDILRNKSIRNILINEQSIGKWENAYDASKPVVVFIQGFTYYKKLEPLISKLCKHYSVFVIEPIDDHFEAIFNEEDLSCRDVVKFYLDYLEACLPSNVSVEMFIGHSFGGELAYRCAIHWHKKTSIMPKVCMLDTFAHIANVIKAMPIPEAKGLSLNEESDIEEIKEWNRHLQRILSLRDNRDLPTYDGDVLYFTAKVLTMKQNIIHINEHELEKKKQEDLNSWKSLAPHMNIYSVTADHFTMLEDRFCDDYIVKIDNIVLSHNS